MADLKTILCSLKAIVSCKAITASQSWELNCDHIKSSSVWSGGTCGPMSWGPGRAKEVFLLFNTCILISTGCSWFWFTSLGREGTWHLLNEGGKKALHATFTFHQYSSPCVLLQGDGASEKGMILAALTSGRFETPLSQRWLHGNYLLGGYFLQLWTNDSFSGWLFSLYLNGCFS